MSQAFALVAPPEQPLRIGDAVAFLQAVRAKRAPAIAIRFSTRPDWTIRDKVRAQLRVDVKRILRKCGDPTDRQGKATETVLEPAEVLSEVWSAA